MRYLPLTHNDRQAMLTAIGSESIQQLYDQVPPDAIISDIDSLPEHKGELEVENIFNAWAKQNHAASDGPFFLGAGCYFHHIPASVDHIIQRSEFLTAYTPYQPEFSQGTLTTLFEFQTMISELTGMDIANASMYDGATAMAEAALMALRITKRNRIFLWNTIHPHYVEVLQSYLQHRSDVAIHETVDQETACVIVQIPDFLGNIPELENLRAQCDAAGALLIVVVTEIISLGMLPAPVLADIVVGEAQSIGVPMSFGGPHLGFFACKKTYIRQIPGRICGATVDNTGKRSFVLTLNTREQHIRREKATSNICTNQGLCALAFTIHMALLGEKGFLHLARLNHERAVLLSEKLSAISGITLLNTSFFNEFTISVPGNAQTLVNELSKQGIIAGLAIDTHRIVIAATEMVSEDDMDTFVSVLIKELS